MSRKKKQNRETEQAPTQGRQGSNFMTAVMGQALGITNLSRSFKASQNHNGPQIAVRIHNSAFPFGWSDTGNIADQNSDDGLDITTPVTNELYPMTPPTQAFVEEHWPILSSLLASGTGTRYPTTRHEVGRYYNSVIQLMQEIAFPLQLNYLTTTFDWSEIAPFSQNVPPAVWGLTELFDANDVGVNDVWKPLFDRLSTKVLPPRLAASVLETIFPYVANQYGHVIRLNAPSSVLAVITSWDIGTYITDIVARLDYLEDELINCHNTLASFLPYRVGSPMAMFKGYDPTFEEIDYNSGMAAVEVFGDTGDPNGHEVIEVGTAAYNGDSIIFYHKGAAPIVKTIVHTPIWDYISETFDDEYVLLSSYFSNYVTFIDDDLNLIQYTGADSSTAEAQRYRGYYPNRFQHNSGSNNLEEGVGKAGFLPAIIAREEIIRANKVYTNFLFGNDQMRAVLAMTGGSSVRTISKFVAEAWANRG